MKHLQNTAVVLSLLTVVAVAHDHHGAHHHKRQGPGNGGPVVVAGTITVPPLASITFGMPTAPIPPSTATATPGAIPPFKGAPPLPNPAWAFTPGEWPEMDKPIDATTPQVQEWMKELEGWDIPDIKPTVDGSCVNDTAAAADAAARGWWTCGGYTRATDIVDCPDKMTWGVSFDDGPAEYSTHLLEYLASTKPNPTLATFFVVGSRVIGSPGLLINEYMAGHEISIHTWSHPHLTALTTPQIVAELGWTRKAIQSVLGVTPTTMRPPYGDIDDRVRAIALAMGMIPVIWTRVPNAAAPGGGFSFDTFDWMVAGGLVKGQDSFATFGSILGNASTLDTGFCVLQHDLYEITVDLAIGYTLEAAMSHQPAFKLEPIGQCAKIPTNNMYRESNTNQTFPYKSPPAGLSASGNSGNKSTSGNGKVAQSGNGGNGTTGTSGAIGRSVGLVVVGMAVGAVGAMTI
ncbi:NodB-like proteiny domain-containing protein [Favolaschia claudopus]|uniref:chitin deacetylase n=1 Tax=Favolaschia claudopus TaxID=2862362 RepID=A0AAW0BFD4_9AGAR